MPKKRTNTRGGRGVIDVPDNVPITLEQVKKNFLEIEALYTSTMEGLQREWDTPEVREQILEQLREVDDLEMFYKLLEKIEICFSDPY